MIDWNRLRLFHVVARAGSFTRAGDVLNLSQSAVSRSVCALEESLKVALFHRHARGLTMTEQGETLFRTVGDVFNKFALAEAAIAETRDATRGPLRITTTVDFGSAWLAPRIGAFCTRYPDIDVQLILTDVELDLATREADVAIWFQPPALSTLVQRRLSRICHHLYGSPSYVDRCGRPATVQSLDDHAILAYGPEVPAALSAVNWPLTEGADPLRLRRPALTVNNLHALLMAVESGFGLAALPDYMAIGRAGLVLLSPAGCDACNDAYFVYPEELRNTKRITVFRDFLVRRLGHEALRQVS